MTNGVLLWSLPKLLTHQVLVRIILCELDLVYIVFSALGRHCISGVIAIRSWERTLTGRTDLCCLELQTLPVIYHPV